MSDTCGGCGADASHCVYLHEGNVESLCEPCGTRLESRLQDAIGRLAEMKIERLMLTRFVDRWRGSHWEVL